MPIIASRASAAYGAGFAAITAPSYAAPIGAYDSLATITVGASSVSSITFAGIPSGYKHLQIRAMHLYSNTGDNMVLSYNNGAFTNTRSHFVYGTGSAAAAGTDTSGGGIISFQSGSTSTAFCVAVYDFLDYADTSKNKTMRGLIGQDLNGSGIVGLVSAFANTTTAINALTFTYNGGANFVANTTFALYGVK
jgi:hypothetical protein